MEQSPRNLTIPVRHCGPPNSGNGGWSAGALASLVELGGPGNGPENGPGNGAENRAGSWPSIEVTLRQPPPLEAPMTVILDEKGNTVASFGGAVVLSARVVPDVDPVPVDAVPAEIARAAEATYPGLAGHPFPTCYACGTDREPGDGLRIFPGPVEPLEGRNRVAATWTPAPSGQAGSDGHIDEDHRSSLADTWAALDCIGAWSADMGERLMVLGRMTAAVDTLPMIGEEHVVTGLHNGTEGRKSFTSTTIHDQDGRIVARAAQVWIAIDPATLKTPA